MAWAAPYPYYRMPTAVHLDVPEIDAIDEPDPHAPVRARGVGEIGITGVGAAVANAVFNATGKRVRDLPVTLDTVMKRSVSPRWCGAAKRPARQPRFGCVSL